MHAQGTHSPHLNDWKSERKRGKNTPKPKTKNEMQNKKLFYVVLLSGIFILICFFFFWGGFQKKNLFQNMKFHVNMFQNMKFHVVCDVCSNHC